MAKRPRDAHGRVRRAGLAGCPGTPRGGEGDQERRRHSNTDLRPPATSRPRPGLGTNLKRPLGCKPVSTERGDAQTPRAGLSLCDPQPCAPAPPRRQLRRRGSTLRLCHFPWPKRPSPLTGRASSRSPESALMALSPPASVSATAGAPSLAPRAPASGSCERRGCARVWLGCSSGTSSSPASAGPSPALRGVRVREAPGEPGGSFVESRFSSGDVMNRGGRRGRGETRYS